MNASTDPIELEQARLERVRDRLLLLRLSLDAAKTLSRQGPRGRTLALVRSILLDPEASILVKRAVAPFAKKWHIEASTIQGAVPRA